MSWQRAACPACPATAPAALPDVAHAPEPAKEDCALKREQPAALRGPAELLLPHARSASHCRMTSQDGQTYTAQNLLGGCRTSCWVVLQRCRERLQWPARGKTCGLALYLCWLARKLRVQSPAPPCPALRWRRGPASRQVGAGRLWEPEQHRRREGHQRHLQARRPRAPPPLRPLHLTLCPLLCHAAGALLSCCHSPAATF